ncbi:MAG: hypothetical protein ABJP70_05420 [Erythrobacter sp.]
MSAAQRKLTERQRAVMERVDRRVPIKVIAQELKVSDTRINQHIRALKNIFGADSLGELVEFYRATKPLQKKESGEEKSLQIDAFKGKKSTENQEIERNHKGLPEAAYIKSQLPSWDTLGQYAQRDDQGELVMNDAGALLDQAPWLRPGEPQVVPRVLDGEHAVLLRLAAVVAIGFGLLGALVLTLTAANTITEALDGRVDVPVDEDGYNIGAEK